MELTDVVDGLVHEPTQTENKGLDLTLASVARVTEPGRIDFGGGELEAANKEPVRTDQRNEDDEYGWWNLEEGVYLIGYNERLGAPADQAVVLQTRDAVRACGSFHPTLHLSGEDPLDEVPFTVGGGGLRVKENARVSTLLDATD